MDGELARGFRAGSWAVAEACGTPLYVVDERTSASGPASGGKSRGGPRALRVKGLPSPARGRWVGEEESAPGTILSGSVGELELAVAAGFSRRHRAARRRQAPRRAQRGRQPGRGGRLAAEADRPGSPATRPTPGRVQDVYPASRRASPPTPTTTWPPAAATWSRLPGQRGFADGRSSPSVASPRCA